MVYTKEVHTQTELNDFLAEYNSEHYVDLIIKATEDITIETDKALIHISVNYSGNNCKFTVRTPLDSITIHDSNSCDFVCKLPCGSVTRVDVRYVIDSTVKLFNVPFTTFNNSFVRLDNRVDAYDGEPNSRIDVHNSFIYVRPEKDLHMSGVLAHANVNIMKGGDVSIEGFADSSNFILTANGNMYIYPNGSVLSDHICAFDNSTITIDQRDRYLFYSKAIQTFDNARVITTYGFEMYKDIFEYCKVNNIEHTDTYGYFYKIVQQEDDDRLTAIFDHDFQYNIGDYVYPNNGFSEDDAVCSSGIHCSSLNYALREFGRGENLVILKLRVEFKDLAPYEPNAIPQKLRCKKAFVEKIVSPETLGARGLLLNRS